jgi:hypothetical protein
MTDIVERLRRWGGPTRPYGSISDTCDEAAARIERLQAALEKINVGEGWAALIARAALSGDKHE